MLQLEGVHHVAIICSDYRKSKSFYTGILGLQIIAEHYREARKSWKLDLAAGSQYVIELFSFPDPPRRLTKPEAQGLRHLAFSVSDLEQGVEWLHQNNVKTESIRIDEYTGKRFTFLRDPDDLPIELYEP